MSLPKNVVIVEDEAITQRYLKDIFEQIGIHVSACVDNAVDTMEVLKTVKCDLILMDINIKGPMDGIQLARQILQHKQLPIIFITAHNDDETVEEVLELAPYGFIGKPFSSRDIVVTLRVAYKRYLTHIENMSTRKEKDSKGILVISNRYQYKEDEKTVYDNGIPVKLNHKQHQLLQILVKNINKTVSGDTLIFDLWGEEDIAKSALRTLVYTLRKVLPDFPIVSHSKMGYMLQIENDKGIDD